MARPSPILTMVTSLGFISSQGYLAYLLGALRPNILCLQLSFSAERYWAILAAWGADGMQAYRDHFAADTLHLCVYALFGYVVATRSGLFAADEEPAAQRLAWLLPLAALFDLAENVLQGYLLAGPFGVASPAIPLSALCSSLKWGLAVWFAGTTATRLLRKWRAGGRLSR